MNDDVLDIPLFPRVSDWFGVWAIEPIAMSGYLAMLGNMDLAAHVRTSEQPKLESLVEKQPARHGQSIAIIKILGELLKSKSSVGGTSTVQLRRDIRQMASDPEVSGILLAIDSPGGSVAGTDDLANDVRAATRQKPVYAHVDDLTASAAYWIASQADKIYANSPTAMIGSIGTMLVIYDASKAAESVGLKAMVFATGPLKGAGTPGTAITEEQRAYFQSLIDQSQKSFDAAVKRGRGLTDKQLSDVRSGAVFLADEAVNRKLIDGIQPLSKTLDELVRDAAPKTAKQMSVIGLPMVKRGLPTTIGG